MSLVMFLYFFISTYHISELKLKGDTMGVYKTNDGKIIKIGPLETKREKNLTTDKTKNDRFSLMPKC